MAVRHAPGLAVILVALLGNCVHAAKPPVDAGRALYEKGERGAGEAIRAVGQNGVVLSGAAAACASCHRRSGLGGSEGPSTIRPIAGRHLFSPPRVRERPEAAAVPAPRQPYGLDSFARAVREGIDVDGRELDRLMPRYALEDEEVAALHAYLETLGTGPVPGVGAHDIHFATIVGPGVPAAARRAMLDVFEAAVRERNAGTRNEARRRDLGRDRMARAYRTWVLHVWELEGEPETWPRQLAAHYRRQPVFAVLGGTAAGTWAPVHGYCEAKRMPCLFPDVDHPGGDGYYSLYFSKGVALEAEVLARHLAESPPPGPIVQVFRDDEVGRLAADTLHGALQKRGIRVLEQPVNTTHGKRESWRALLAAAKPGVLVLWDDPQTLALGEKGEAPPAGLDAIYVSASLSGLQTPDLPGSWQDKLRVVSPFVLPADRAHHLARLRAWLAVRGMPFAAERAQANAFFAVSVAGDALAHMGENITRDYFIERIEQMAGTPLFPSMYPHLSLGPGQRYASRGAYILGQPHGREGPWVPVRNWTVP